MSFFIVLALFVTFVFFSLEGFDFLADLAFFVLSVFVVIKIVSGLIGFFKEFSKNEFVEVEKSTGSEPSEKTIQEIIEDAGEVLLNENKPKGNITKRIGKGAEEFLEKSSKLFKH